MLGLISFDSGSIEILGKDSTTFTPKDKELLGVVLSDSSFSGYLTIKDILPILKSLYTEFDTTKFIERLQEFQLPLEKIK